MKSFLSFIFLLIFTLKADAQYSTPGNFKSWTPDSLVFYSSGTVTGGSAEYQIHQNLTVSATDTLALLENAVFRIAAGCTITVRGTMFVDSPGEVVFTAIDTSIASAYYHGLRFENTPASVIRRARFEFGKENRITGSNMLIEYCTFRKNNSTSTSGALSVFQCNPVIRFNTFFHNNSAAIASAANAAASPKIIGNHIYFNNTSNANAPQINLGLGSTDTLVIRDNIIEGFYANAGGIGISNLTGTGQMICRVENNHVFNNRYGIAFLGYPVSGHVSSNRIENNNIQNNPNLGGSGINFNGNSTTNQMIVSNNIITGNLWGITIQGQAQPNLGDLSLTAPNRKGRNIIYGNGNNGIIYALYNNTPNPVKAENNFWGSVIRDSVERYIFHRPDNASLGFVDYLPIWDTANAPSLFIDTITISRDTIHVGGEKINQLIVTNIGNQDLRLTLKDTFGIQTEQGGLTISEKNGIKKRQQNLWSILRRIRNLEIPASLLNAAKQYEASNIEGSEAVIVTDPANDFNGRPHNVTGLTYPDITSIDLSITSGFPVILRCTTSYNSPIDTNMVGVISLDTDQDFMTGMYPPLANLGASNTDVGSDYEIIFTTKPSLYFQSDLGSTPAVLIKWLPDTINIIGAATGITRTGNAVRFSILLLSAFDDNNMNAASGFIEVDSTFDIFNYENYAPKRIPDAAPDIGHGRLGAEKDPSWFGMDVKSDTLFQAQTGSFQFITLGSVVPGQYSSTVILKSNDPARTVLRFPYSLTVLPELQPQVDPSSLAVNDTVIVGGAKNIQVILNNSGPGYYRYFLADTADTPWLSAFPRMGAIAPGSNAVVTVAIDASALAPGNYNAQWLMVSSDTMNTTVPLPVSIAVMPSVGITEEPRRPLKYALYPNYPNPFNPSTVMRYQLAGNSDVRLAIYNLLGQEIRTLVNTRQPAGNYSVIWDGKDNRGIAVGSGVYFYRMTAGKFSAARKTLLLK